MTPPRGWGVVVYQIIYFNDVRALLPDWDEEPEQAACSLAGQDAAPASGVAVAPDVVGLPVAAAALDVVGARGAAAALDVAQERYVAVALDAAAGQHVVAPGAGWCLEQAGSGRADGGRAFPQD